MKILYVLNSGSPGGMEQHVLDLVSGMKKNGHEVFVWCLPGIIFDWYKKAGAKVYTNNRIRFDIDPIYVFSLWKFLIKNRIDIIHAHEIKAVSNAFLAAIFAGTKVKISHTHTPVSEWEHMGLFKKIVGRMQVLGYAILVDLFASKEIALTYSRKSTKEKDFILGKKIEVIPNGVDFSRLDSGIDRGVCGLEMRKKYGIPRDAFVFGNVSRMTAEKDHETLVKAFSLLFQRRKKESLFLFLAGGGLLEDKIKNLVKVLGLEKRVVITGVFSDKDWAKNYCVFDCFVFPSLAEGFGLVLVEGMYTGVPVICSDLEVLHEVAGNTVLYFKKRNIDDLADKMDEVLDNYEEKKILGLSAKHRVEEMYSMEKFVSAYESLYSRLLKGEE